MSLIEDALSTLQYIKSLKLPIWICYGGSYDADLALDLMDRVLGDGYTILAALEPCHPKAHRLHVLNGVKGRKNVQIVDCGSTCTPTPTWGACSKLVDAQRELGYGIAVVPHEYKPFNLSKLPFYSHLVRRDDGLLEDSWRLICYLFRGYTTAEIRAEAARLGHTTPLPQCFAVCRYDQPPYDEAEPVRPRPARTARGVRRAVA